MSGRLLVIGLQHDVPIILASHRLRMHAEARRYTALRNTAGAVAKALELALEIGVVVPALHGHGHIARGRRCPRRSLVVVVVSRGGGGVVVGAAGDIHPHVQQHAGTELQERLACVCATPVRCRNSMR